MRFDVITLFPAMFESLSCDGVIARAISEKRIELCFWNPRDYTEDRHRTVDDRPYGGGPGMVMKYAPLKAALAAVKAAKIDDASEAKVVLLSPQGQPLNQDAVKRFAQRKRMILVCGRYEGIDQRFIDAEVDEEWSIGDFVVSGGELPTMMLIDAVGRMLPGVLGHEESALQDSFYDGLLDCPHYTRPEVIDGRETPAVLLSGNHQEIAKWRQQMALEKTKKTRPDLINKRLQQAK